MDTHKVGSDTTVLADSLDIPGIGHIPVNAYVLTASEPVVVDTGLSLADRDFVATLGSVMDPADVRWIWLTHPDRDHTGGIFELLDAAPEARVVTTFLGAGIMTTERPLPMDRVYFLNPGQSLDVGDRMLRAFKPPLFDNPATVGFYDDRTRICFSSDCFGGPMPTAELAESGHANDLKPEDLRAAQLLWATVDSPWVHIVDPAKYRATIQPLLAMNPEIVLSTHLPPAVRMTSLMIDTITMAPDADPFVGPDQAALEQMLATFEPGGAPA
ncbi:MULTISPECIES: MBL fold metallo-hydrolase [Streptomyces]|uniref:MBL fold metallo-hydrolase n=1 Tax=Streptomyces solicathayae TaxID=3081768 RepID=A0ABZ0LUJ3_9ACTN|nr:MBL fold metallo-hydrolase [Streptomyces sp. HUAS YS2]WOX23168.1 MBL fold metallo-hydrolase [Streptomyces sp. HUAS YS2]